MNDRVRQVGNLLTLRSLLVGLLGLLGCAVTGLLLVLVVSGANRSSSRTRDISSAVVGLSGNPEPSVDVSSSATVDPEPVRSIFVDVLPIPEPLRLSRVEFLPAEALEHAELNGLVRRVDKAIVVMSPAVSYLGTLASQSLRGEVSRIRVLAESGAMADVLTRPEVGSLFKEMAVSAHSIEELLRAVRTAAVSGQFNALQTLTAPTRVTEQMQQAVEDRAISAFLDLSLALETGIAWRNELVLRSSNAPG